MSASSGLPTLGRYQLVREIARSNDIVWEGRDPQVSRRVAVKELSLPSNLTGQPRRDRIERFYREARAAGGMNHPNIVTIYEVGEDRGRFFIAMEYLEGHTLRERLNVGGPIPLAEAGKIAADLCAALQYAHERGIVHRDVKPDNIHLLPGNQVKLTDFGIARITSEAQLTVAGQVFGTPSYMSPEQVLGHPIDARSDQFSLAIVVYEMIGGVKPFSGDSVPTITYRIIHEPAPHILGAPPAVDAILQRAMAKDPAARFGSVAEFAAALNGVIALGTGSFAAARPVPRQPAGPAYGTGSYAPGSAVYAAPTAAGYPPSQTAMYGAQTQFGVAPGAAAAPVAPVAPVVPELLQAPYPLDRGAQPYGTNNQKTIAAVLISVLVIGGVLIGGGFVLSKALHNFSGGSQSHEADERFAKATNLYNFGDYQDAAVGFNEVRILPGASIDEREKSIQYCVYCYRQLAHKAQDDGDLTTAAKWYQSALTVAPGDAQTQEEMASVQRQLTASGQSATAVPFGGPDAGANPAARLDGAIPLSNPSGPPSNATGEDFKNANAQANSQAAALVQQGTAAEKSGDYLKAQALYNQAISAGPGSESARQAADLIQQSLKAHPEEN